MTITDGLGIWAELGILEPSFDEWRLFAVPTVQGKTFRLIFTSADWTKKGNTWLWIRHLFYNNQTTLSQKVYPRETPVIIEMPIPQEFVTAGNITTYIECKKGGRFRLGVTPHVSWSVAVQEKIQ